MYEPMFNVITFVIGMLIMALTLPPVLLKMWSDFTFNEVVFVNNVYHFLPVVFILLYKIGETLYDKQRQQHYNTSDLQTRCLTLSIMLLLLSSIFFMSAATFHVVQMADVKPEDRVEVAEECMLAMHAAHRVRQPIHDINGDGIIDIEDIGPAAIEFGMHYVDVNKDGMLSHKEVQDAFTKIAAWYVRLGSWFTSFVTSKYSPEQVFIDCDNDKDGKISRADWQALRYETCMEWCGKAEDVFNYIGSGYGLL
jgi:hypothetical protein